MIKRPALAVACAVLVAAPILPAAAAAATTATPARGTLVKTELAARLSDKQVSDYLTQAGFPQIEGAKGVDVYSVTYRTVGVRNEPTIATGAVVLPRTSDRSLRVVSYAHGTMATKKNAPSVEAKTDGRYISVYFATQGYAAVAPDYLGLGGGPGRHPYLHSATEASASLDLLKAARTLAGQKQVELDPRILVTGFSQGGHAAMALGAELQRDEELEPAAIAPVSGPYDLENAELPALLKGELYPPAAAFYLAYWLTSTDRIYDIYRNPAKAFSKPYAAKITKVFNGHQDFNTILANLPDSPEKLVTADYLKTLANPSGPLLKALRENDATCEDVRPGVPVRLFASRGDREVAIANSTNCLKDLESSGVEASLVDVGEVDHNTSVMRSLPQVLAWFRQS